ncbi:unnamed protein product, partial [Amoebophrya sp. A25]
WGGVGTAATTTEAEAGKSGDETGRSVTGSSSLRNSHDENGDRKRHDALGISSMIDADSAWALDTRNLVEARRAQAGEAAHAGLADTERMSLEQIASRMPGLPVAEAYARSREVSLRNLRRGRERGDGDELVYEGRDGGNDHAVDDEARETDEKDDAQTGALLEHFGKSFVWNPDPEVIEGQDEMVEVRKA